MQNNFHFIRKHHLTRKAPKSPLVTWMVRILIGGTIAGLFGLVVLLIAIAELSGDLPQLKAGTLANVESTIIYDREGNVLYTIHGEENRKEVPLNNIPKSLVDATISVEDDQFYEHFGIDPGGIIKASLNEFLGIGKQRGGSTITQQLVKNTLLSPERTLTRKLKEILLAIQVERTFSKNEILEMYFNTIPYGSNAYGVEMASRTFFDKSSQELTLLESAILASLPKAPSKYSPYGPNKQLLMGYFDEEGNYIPGRKDIVLMRMEELGYITHEQRLNAIQDSDKITFKQLRQDIEAPHFVMYIKQILEDKFGKEAVETGGLKVFTTIDPYLQKKAEQIVADRVKTWPEQYGVHNTSLFSVDLETGQMLAMIGSVDYFNEEIDGNVNMVLRKRLAGSSFKPIVYAAGIAKGYSPATVLFDLETDFGNDYIPNNYDGTFSGPVTMRQALARSLNIPAVKMTYLAGVDEILTLAKKMGITSLKGPDQYGLSLGLGTGETTLHQMVTAFSVFAKGGELMEFNPFLRIEDAHGKVIESYEDVKPKTEEVLDPQIAYTINHILSDASIRPAAWNITLQIPDQINAVKTGTSNKKIRENGKDIVKPLDTWTIGYTTKVITGVWAGNNDSSPVNYSAAGFSTAGKVWHDFMVAATEDKPLEEFPKPKGITWKSVARLSGKQPSPNTPTDQIYSELFTTFNIPEEMDNVYQEIEIDRVSGKLPTRFTPAESRIKAIVANFHSNRPEALNWELPVQEWAKAYVKKNDTIIDEVPTGTDDIHTAETAKASPIIEMTAPMNEATVNPGIITVQSRISASHSVEKVEYYVQGRLMETVTVAPYEGHLRIILKRPRPYKITAKVYDKLFYTSEDSINIYIADVDDTSPPEASIIFPTKNSTFHAGETISVQTLAKDDIAVAKVIFHLDGEKVVESNIFPYSTTLKMPTTLGKHTLSILATDGKGNRDDDEVEITITEKAVVPSETTAGKNMVFLQPTDKKTIKAINNTISFSIKIDEKTLATATEITIVAMNTQTNTRQTIYSMTDTKNLSDTLSFAWTGAQPGEYTFAIMATTSSNITTSSAPITVTIE